MSYVPVKWCPLFLADHLFLRRFVRVCVYEMGEEQNF